MVQDHTRWIIIFFPNEPVILRYPQVSDTSILIGSNCHSNDGLVPAVEQDAGAWGLQGMAWEVQKCAFYHQEQGGKPPKIGTLVLKPWVGAKASTTRSRGQNWCSGYDEVGRSETQPYLVYLRREQRSKLTMPGGWSLHTPFLLICKNFPCQLLNTHILVGHRHHLVISSHFLSALSPFLIVGMGMGLNL